MSTNYLFTPPGQPSLPIRGKAERLPIRRIFCVGRNYHAHAVEMGKPVDKSVDVPFYFTKSPLAYVPSGATTAYPPGTKNYHFEMELVIAIGKAGFRIKPEQAHEVIYGYACGLDMTRRDLQLVARDKGKPWDLAKDIEQGAVMSEIVPMPGVVLEQGAIELRVNGASKQSSDLKMLIWNIREILADLSQFYHLEPGDVIFTGTPEGVGPVVEGDKLEGSVAGVGAIALTIGPAER
jgi:fumarylpyruvate hydrolase